MSSRRQFLVSLGLGTYSLMRSISAEAAKFPLPRHRPSRPPQFQPIRASQEDQLKLPPGFRYDRIASFGDALGSIGPEGPETFGSDCDFNAFFPIGALEGDSNSHDGLLWTNHEFISPAYVRRERPKSREKVRAEKLAVGGSILHIQKKKNVWSRLPDPKFTRRYTALYPKIEFTGPVKDVVPHGTGTIANCSGGRTPWNTVLTCEENFHLFNRMDEDSGCAWSTHPEDTLDEKEYGYVVEIDPFGQLPPKKHSSLGKFAHENAALTFGKSGRLVAYMGDDSANEYVYKFISREAYQPKGSRSEASRLFETGVLYVANFEKGKWLALDLELSPQLRNAGFKTQADVLLRTREAAKLLGATPVDRPEDCEVNPKDGTVYIALTNNGKHGNLWGQILRLLEDQDNPEALTFRYEIFLAGGPASGLACPDNLLFDRKGNLWVACDISSTSLGQGAYQPFGNNGLYCVPTEGSSAGYAFQFASGPRESEITGPCFSPDERTLFLSIQHPGEAAESAQAASSHWPDGGSSLAKSTVVAVSGF